MEIKINGNPETVSENKMLSEILKDKGLDNEGIVVLVNDSVIKRDNWNDHLIKENDSIELLSFVSGG